MRKGVRNEGIEGEGGGKGRGDAGDGRVVHLIHTPDPVCCEVVLQLKGEVLQWYLALHGPAGSCLHITKLYQFLYQL